jgi:hypothetical protein
VGQIVVGRSELASRWVHWVNVLHWPAGDAVRPGDLVLTTAVAPSRDDAREFLHQLVSSPAAAAVISMPNDIRLTGVLPDVIEAATERGFPVVLLPWEVPFADVTRAVLTRLLAPAGPLVTAAPATADGCPPVPAVTGREGNAPRGHHRGGGPDVSAELLRASARRSGRVRVQVGLGYPPDRRGPDWARHRDLFLARVEAMARRGGASVRTQRGDQLLLVVLEGDASDGPTLGALLEQSDHGTEVARWVVTDTDSQDADRVREFRLGQHIVGGQQRSFESQSLESLTLLGVLAQSEHVTSVVAEAIGSLVAYDRDHRSRLIETVDVYLDEACNTSAAARRLFLNRHSLMYRLQKVEALTGFSLREPADRFFLHTAVRLYRFRLLQSADSADGLAAVDDDGLSGDERR